MSRLTPLQEDALRGFFRSTRDFFLTGGAALASASSKDGGLTPAQLAWVLSEVRIGHDARVPGGISVPELRGFVADLVKRLSRLAYPGGPPQP